MSRVPAAARDTRRAVTPTEGTSRSADPDRDAQALWGALHGLVTLVPATPGFPWRPTDEALDRMITALTEDRTA